MICRIGHGWTTPANADKYEALLGSELLRSELLRDARDSTRWRIQTWWASAEALQAMRGAGTPAGVLMFRAADAEPALSIFNIEHALPRGQGA